MRSGLRSSTDRFLIPRRIDGTAKVSFTLSSVTVDALLLLSNGQHISLDHLFNQRVKADLVLPVELAVGPAGIPHQDFNFGRPKITRVDLYQHLARRAIDPLLLRTRAFPLDVAIDQRKGALDELPYRMTLASGQHVV